MLSFFVLLFLSGGLSSLLPLSEIIKIISLLFMIPLMLYCSVKLSQRPSIWTVSEDAIEIAFKDQTMRYAMAEIALIRCLNRSGGSLYIFSFPKQPTARYWRNKLFQAEDDSIALDQALTAASVAYHKF